MLYDIVSSMNNTEKQAEKIYQQVFTRRAHFCCFACNDDPVIWYMHIQKHENKIINTETEDVQVVDMLVFILTHKFKSLSLLSLVAVDHVLSR